MPATGNYPSPKPSNWHWQLRHNSSRYAWRCQCQLIHLCNSNADPAAALQMEHLLAPWRALPNAITSVTRPDAADKMSPSDASSGQYSSSQNFQMAIKVSNQLNANADANQPSTSDTSRAANSITTLTPQQHNKWNKSLLNEESSLIPQHLTLGLLLPTRYHHMRPLLTNRCHSKPSTWP